MRQKWIPQKFEHTRQTHSPKPTHNTPIETVPKTSCGRQRAQAFSISSDSFSSLFLILRNFPQFVLVDFVPLRSVFCARVNLKQTQLVGSKDFKPEPKMLFDQHIGDVYME